MSLWRNGDPLDGYLNPAQASSFQYASDPMALAAGFDTGNDPLSDFIAWGAITPTGWSRQEVYGGTGDSVGEGPGDCWVQAKTPQEKKQGYMKTDVMTLAMRAQQIRDKATEISEQSAGQSPEVEALKASAIELSLKCNSFRDYPAQYATGTYQALLGSVNKLQATLDDIISRIEPAPEDAPAPPPKQVQVKVPATPTTPATVKTVTQPVPPPVVKIKPKLSTFTLAAGAAVAAVVVTKVAGLW